MKTKIALSAAMLIGSVVSAAATDIKVVCPSACTVTLPATTWDQIGGALNDAVTVRQQLYNEISRQLREQMPKAEPSDDVDRSKGDAPSEAKPK